MNIDIFAATQFNDGPGLKSFFLAHRFIHDAEALAITAKFRVPFSTFGISSSAAEEAWEAVMRAGAEGEKLGEMPPALRDWLTLHAQIHTSSYSLFGSTGTVAPDLSVADFSSAQSFGDWMYVHQQMHDFEQQQLGIS